MYDIDDDNNATQTRLATSDDNKATQTRLATISVVTLSAASTTATTETHMYF